MNDSTKRTVRTAFAGTVAAVALFPVVVSTSGVDVQAVPYLAGGVAVCTAVTRVLALPGVNAWLRTFVPWLALDSGSLGAAGVEPGRAGRGDVKQALDDRGL